MRLLETQSLTRRRETQSAKLWWARLWEMTWAMLRLQSTQLLPDPNRKLLISSALPSSSPRFPIEQQLTTTSKRPSLKPRATPIQPPAPFHRLNAAIAGQEQRALRDLCGRASGCVVGSIIGFGFQYRSPHICDGLIVVG